MTAPRDSSLLPLPLPSRRDALGRFGLGLGGMAFSSLITEGARGAARTRIPKAHRVISLFMAGGPGQHERRRASDRGTPIDRWSVASGDLSRSHATYKV